jgi:polysaccharide biosynthesis/export protein
MLLGGCATTPDPLIGPASTERISELGHDDYSYRAPKSYALRPADIISISVFREPDFSISSLRIGVEGNVSVPLLGSIPVAGMTAKDFERDLTQRLAGVGLKAPVVSVNIVEYSSHLVTVEGSVENPGVYSFQPGARLSAAIALAKGPRNTAKRDQVAVFRETDDAIMIAKFDYRQISQGTMLDPVLQPGDRVVVGTDGLAVFWQDLLKTIPVFGAFAIATTRVSQ